MKKIYFLMVLFLVGAVTSYSQTVHSIIFANKEEPNREPDRTAEYNKMSEFCTEIAQGLGYTNDLRRHSGREFTSIMAETEIKNLRVSDGDIVIFYYDGHGCNWDDDDWPHMAFLDKQYWETTLYDKLKAACQNAKLTLLIAGCCNMDTEGRRRGGGNRQYGVMDKTKLKILFTGFDGRISIKSSASRRGQYSYSITGGSDMGNVYAMNVRDAIREAVSSSSSGQSWDDVMNAAAKGSYDDTRTFESGPQQPQHKIEKFVSKQKPTTPATTPTTTPTSTSTGQLAKATFKRINATGMKLKDGGYVTILASFETHNMNEQGGRIVAFINGQDVKTVDFGTHYIHNTFSNKVIMIPAGKVISLANNGIAKIRVGIYDYKQKNI